MAKRYCGLVTISIRYVDSAEHSPNGHYRVYLSCPVTMARRGYSATIGAPRYSQHAVDSAEAYDDVARAALSFLQSEVDAKREECAYNGHRDLLDRAVQGWDPSKFDGCGWEVYRREIDAIDSKGAL